MSQLFSRTQTTVTVSTGNWVSEISFLAARILSEYLFFRFSKHPSVKSFFVQRFSFVFSQQTLAGKFLSSRKSQFQKSKKIRSLHMFMFHFCMILHLMIAIEFPEFLSYRAFENFLLISCSGLSLLCDSISLNSLPFVTHKLQLFETPFLL